MRALLLTRVLPLGFVVGAAMEAFMYFTGFWAVATRKEAERRAEREAAAAAARAARRASAAAAAAGGGSGGGGAPLA